MRFVDLLHRWGGGILGLVLFVLGLTGTVLLHKEEWIMLPHANDTRVEDPVSLANLTANLLAKARDTSSIIYPTDRFGLAQTRNAQGGGTYANQAGEIVASWETQWERPELWLFDLHHHLFAGEMGEIIAGIAGLAALLFIITGSILWWRTRRTFRLRLIPARISRPAILMHHRDLGIVVAPLLLLTALTGTMMIFRPVATFVLSPISSPGVIEGDFAPPTYVGGELSPSLDWAAIVMKAHQTYPGAQLRILSLPKNAGDPITIRMKQSDEWLPNGRTLLWFDARTGEIVTHRSALKMAKGTQLYNMAYPIHAAKVGGLLYRLVMTLVGVAMTLLGSLAVWSFWLKRTKRKQQFKTASNF
jgi:uncharacterized iron-regulated membrane protein